MCRRHYVKSFDPVPSSTGAMQRLSVVHSADMVGRLHLMAMAYVTLLPRNFLRHGAFISARQNTCGMDRILKCSSVDGQWAGSERVACP